jgi:hypothetical protein
VSRRDLRGEVGEAVFALEPAGLSPVIATGAGCQVFMLRQILPATEPTFVQVQDRIVKELAEERRLAWRVELLAAAAGKVGAPLPPWLNEEGPLPSLAADEALFVHGGERILLRDLAARRTPEEAPRAVLRMMIEEIVLAAALEAESTPAEVEALLAGPRRELGVSTLLRRHLQKRQEELPETALAAHFESHRDAYQSDPRVELTVWSWPLGPGDPVAALARPRRFVAALAAGADPAAAWAEHRATGASREAVPETGLRELLEKRPELAPLIARADLAAGTVVGPFRTRRRLLVGRVDTWVPPRPLSQLEARRQVLADYVRENAETLRTQWFGELAAAHRFEVQHEHLASFGARLIDRLESAPAEGG